MFNTYTSDGLVYVCVTIQEITYESRSRMFVTCESIMYVIPYMIWTGCNSVHCLSNCYDKTYCNHI